MKIFNKMKFNKFINENLKIEEIEDPYTIKLIIKSCFKVIITCIAAILVIDMVEVVLNAEMYIDRFFLHILMVVYTVRGFHYCKKLR